MLIRSLAALVLGAMAGCSDQSNVPEGATKAIHASEAYAKEMWGESLSDMRPVVHDDDQWWIVSYHLPSNTLGGAPMFVVDKEAHLVVRADRGGQ